MKKKLCNICGKEFVPAHGLVVQCSDACKIESKRRIALRQLEKRREKTRARLGTRICTVCGKEFQPKNPQMVMCSKECNGSRQRRNENKQKLRKAVKEQKVIVTTKRKEKNEKLVREAVQANEAGMSYGKAEMNRYLEKQSIEMALRRRELQAEWERRKHEG